ncbi:tagatose kinase [Stagnihabitans tardus]|uniref:Sugar kinase n=1 Tax=Stagnihabitans tardus TaxID=2699202 RepID=A0AAE5BUV9_9RHOB|nr:sugar kinase [Stagnihabitans tardus]NBZ87184.1 sugar kinase [Stagnihabitans tardus]
MLSPDSLGPTITFGEILVEIMATLPGHGFTEALDLRGPFPSGAPAIFISQCARLGGQAGIVGCVGDDDFGRLNTDRLRADGADVSAVAISPDLPTGTAFVRYRPDGGRDFVFNIAKSAAGQIAMTPEARALVARAGHLHVMGSAFAIPHLWAVLAKAIPAVKSRGGSVSLDPNLRKELMTPETSARLAQVVAQCDLLLPSGPELQLAAGLPDATEAEAVAALLQKVPEIVLKRGDQGATLFTREGRLDQAAFAVTEIDPTGAGDCFGAAYLTARRLGLAEPLRLAAAAGARNVTVLGPMEGAGTLQDLNQFIAARI